MRKKVIFALVLVFYIITTIVFATERIYQVKNNEIQIGPEIIHFTNRIYNIEDKTYVPIRELAEALRIPIIWDSDNDRVFLNNTHKMVHVPEKSQYKEEGVIPDEATALKIGKIILETYAGKSLEYETDERNYYLTVSYNEEYNSWLVKQSYSYKDGTGGGAVGIYEPAVILNKNTGEVISINTYSELE